MKTKITSVPMNLNLDIPEIAIAPKLDSSVFSAPPDLAYWLEILN